MCTTADSAHVTTLTRPHDPDTSAASDHPTVDVVILTWNDGKMLDAAITSALEADGVQVSVIVVDNGSEPPAMVTDDPRVTLIRNETNTGVAPARNQGVMAGHSPWVCLLDSDARLHLDTLEELYAHANEAVGLVAPVFDGQLPEASGGRAPGFLRKAARGLGITNIYGSTRPNDRSHLWEVDFAIGACQLIRRSAFEEVGGLDDTIFYGPEDVDFCLRLKETGWQVMQTSDAGCHHPPRRRNRRLLTRRGLAHTFAVLSHLRRHRRRVRTSLASPASR